ncbi:MAG: hypothetical protein COZ46_06710 [Verrucomicrobia bacterium CG_4_10_14_3_um_filter_43_23]|nr:MAG: hypothetical protein COZ46_06710 [Verrucomicrobia bacterium CG_4_10_14_3_um_filter_43_23]
MNIKQKITILSIFIAAISNLYAEDCPDDLKDYFDMPEGCCYSVGNILVTDIWTLSNNLGQLVKATKDKAITQSQAHQIKQQVDAANNFIILCARTSGDVTIDTIKRAFKQGFDGGKVSKPEEASRLIEANDVLINKNRLHFSTLEELAKSGFTLKISKFKEEIIGSYFCRNEENPQKQLAMHEARARYENEMISIGNYNGSNVNGDQSLSNM